MNNLLGIKRQNPTTVERITKTENTTKQGAALAASSISRSLAASSSASLISIWQARWRWQAAPLRCLDSQALLNQIYHPLQWSELESILTIQFWRKLWRLFAQQIGLVWLNTHTEVGCGWLFDLEQEDLTKQATLFECKCSSTDHQLKVASNISNATEVPVSLPTPGPVFDPIHTSCAKAGYQNQWQKKGKNLSTLAEA